MWVGERGILDGKRVKARLPVVAFVIQFGGRGITIAGQTVRGALMVD